jgi:hypothetical protein
MPHAHTEDQHAPRTLTRPLPAGEEIAQPAIRLFAELGWTTVSALRVCGGERLLPTKRANGKLAG